MGGKSMERPFTLKKCDICGEETHRRTTEYIHTTTKGSSKIFHLCDKCEAKFTQYRINADVRFLIENKVKSRRSKCKN